MGKDDTYKLSENPAPNYDAWEFRTRISASAQSKDLLETLLDNDPEPTTGRNGKIWKAWKSIGIVTGNPGVFQGNPHPYPRKTAPVVMGCRFH